jgi:hypothetical protein
VLHKNKSFSKLLYQLLVSVLIISRRNVSLFHIIRSIRETILFLVADGAKTDEWKIKITENEACILQNQVREEMKALCSDALCSL